MYDYVSIHSKNYAEKVKAEILEKFLVGNLGFEKISHLKFSKELCGEWIGITGISASLEGNYAFFTLEGIEEVNVVEIDLPESVNKNLERVISDIAVAISNEFAWVIDEDHGLS